MGKLYTLYSSLHDYTLCVYNVAKSASICCILIELHYTRFESICWWSGYGFGNDSL